MELERQGARGCALRCRLVARLQKVTKKGYSNQKATRKLYPGVTAVERGIVVFRVIVGAGNRQVEFAPFLQREHACLKEMMG